MDELVARQLLESLGCPGDDRASADHLALVHRILTAWIAEPGSTTAYELIRHAVTEFDAEWVLLTFTAVCSTLASTRTDASAADVLDALRGTVSIERTVPASGGTGCVSPSAGRQSPPTGEGRHRDRPRR